MIDKFQNLTINKESLRKVPIQDKLALARSPAASDIFGDLSPTEISKMFPTYYQKNDPAVGNLTGALADPSRIPNETGSTKPGGSNRRAAPVKTPLSLAEHIVMEANIKEGRLSGGFKQQAPVVMKRLMQDFNLTKEQAAGIVGNLGHESAGLQAGIQEQNPLSGRGGLGWAQWTGPRRVAFENYLKETGMSADDPEANYGFLSHELRTSERESLEQLRNVDNAYDATIVFEQSYERAGVKHYDSRWKYTQEALGTYDEYIASLEGQNQDQTGPNVVVTPETIASVEGLDPSIINYYNSLEPEQKNDFLKNLNRLGSVENMNASAEHYYKEHPSQKLAQNANDGPTAQNITINDDVLHGRAPFISGNDFAVPVYTNGTDQKIFDENLENMTPQAKERIKQAAVAAKAAGLDKLELYGAQTHEGHVSHGGGTEFDVVGYNPDGTTWTKDQRAITAAGPVMMGGADRVGFYGSGRGLHIGKSGEDEEGPTVAGAWGPEGKTSNVSVSEFTPGHEQSVAAYLKGESDLPKETTTIIQNHYEKMAEAQKNYEKTKLANNVKTETPSVTPAPTPPVASPETKAAELATISPSEADTTPKLAAGGYMNEDNLRVVNKETGAPVADINPGELSGGLQKEGGRVRVEPNHKRKADALSNQYQAPEKETVAPTPAQQQQQPSIGRMVSTTTNSQALIADIPDKNALAETHRSLHRAYETGDNINRWSLGKYA